jgi:hypothetical protein
MHVGIYACRYGIIANACAYYCIIVGVVLLQMSVTITTVIEHLTYTSFSLLCSIDLYKDWSVMAHSADI